MLSKRFLPFIAPLLMSLFMVTLMTGLITAINTGVDKGFTWRWLSSFSIAWPMAYCFILLFSNKVGRLAQRICSLED
ncbi:DUF2798 domain-containing protein [Vibrio hannami]|uniref:DUF2798 domain-containing protein n=1 Tax=Vibrio hannami TaxID=2717094 RepID=UPI00240F1AC4|nr:DUF2798 domain-containing protein [Vibrio hannami]MDG3087455.1 DUF2798 domain-containing protein [Vibrio hannami]